MDTNSISDVKLRLEMAAEIIMLPPGQVTAQDRKSAEALFIELREGAIPVEQCRQILEATKNHFLMFEISRALVARLLKEWKKFPLDEVRNVCDYLLSFPVTHSNLPNFVSTEIFHSVSMCVKRASVASDALFNDLLLKLETYLNSENQQLQAYGLQIIELVATEFSTTWRSSGYSITWDFHLTAKKQFEDILLKRLMQLSLSTLSRLMNSSDLSSPLDQRVCDKFLCVSQLILTWNFSPKYLYLHFKILISALRTNSFRPPESWHDLFEDASIVTFFMQLHSRIRFDEQLCQNSLVCLTQLASLMGDALGSGPVALVMPHIREHGERRLATSMSGTELEKDVESKTLLTHDLYVQTFATQMIHLFSGGVLDYEMPSLTLLIYKLFTCHPIVIFERFPAELLRSFVDFVMTNLLKLIEPAMQLALRNDQTYHEPLGNLFQVWRSMLRSTYAFSQEIADFINNQNPRIVETFIKSVLSPPFGNRSKPSSDEIYEENKEDDDDRQMFMDLLCDIGFFSLYAVDFFTEYVSRALVQRLRELHSINITSCTHDQFQTWQEDFHWLLLLLGYFMRQPSYSNIGNYPEELAMRCINGYKTGEFVKITDYEPLFKDCLINPPFDPASYPGKLDPISLIATQVLSWFSMEHQMLVKLDPNTPLLSPMLCQTSLWQFSLFSIVLTPSLSFINVSAQSGEDTCGELDESEKNNGDDSIEELKYLPSIATKSALSGLIIELALEKLFAILTKMAGEKKLCVDVIEMMINFAEYRAEELALNEHLYQLLSHWNIEKLPARRPFVKSLVLIGSTVESVTLRQKMHSTVLEPLMNRFLAVTNDLESNLLVDSDLADYFECFAGVADAGQSDTANRLFAYLQPVFQYCVPILTKRSDSQFLLVSILEFIKSATDVLFFYVESQEGTVFYHQLLINIIGAYKETQLQRFLTTTFTSTNDVGDEQQCQDLNTLIEILCLFQSKTYLPLKDDESACVNSAKLSLHGLEMLLPLMSEELLKVPQLCASFFRLLIFISDIAPEALVQVAPQMLSDFMRCVSAAMDNVFGIERVRSALEIITNFAHYCEREKKFKVKQFDNYPLMEEQLLALIPKTFKLATEFSVEVEIFNEATSALFALILMRPDSFNTFVAQLLIIPSNQENRERLANAFEMLLAPSPQFSTPSERGLGREKRQFQNRFQDFLVEVSGSLCLN